uniref:Uncharacterized protein n=1 Tax=Arion vulgaris TaxID=1028688 RepID=A0A0B7BAK2_9EUPU
MLILCSHTSSIKADNGVEDINKENGVDNILLEDSMSLLILKVSNVTLATYYFQKHILFCTNLENCVLLNRPNAPATNTSSWTMYL